MSRPELPRRPLTAEQQDLVAKAIPKLHRALNGDPKFKPWVRWYDTYDDAFQAAMLGVVRAAEKFEPKLGNQFWTFAYWWALNGLQRIRRGGCRALLVGRPVYGSGGVNRMEYMTQVETGPDAKSSLIELQGADDDAIDRRDDQRLAAELLRHIDRRYRDMLLMRMQGFTFAEVGAAFGVTRERVRQIEEKSLIKLRRKAREASCPR